MSQLKTFLPSAKHIYVLQQAHRMMPQLWELIRAENSAGEFTVSFGFDLALKTTRARLEGGGLSLARRVFGEMCDSVIAKE